MFRYIRFNSYFAVCRTSFIDDPIYWLIFFPRRKNYRFYCQLDKQILIELKIFVFLVDEQQMNSANYLPNTNELTIKYNFTTTLNRVLPLNQFTKFIIQSFAFPFLQLIELLSCTSNLHILTGIVNNFYSLNTFVCIQHFYIVVQEA